MIKDILDRIARTLGLEPDVVRERYFYREGDSTHYDKPVKDAARIESMGTELNGSSDFDARWSAVAKFKAANPQMKRGLAITPAKFAISFTATFFNQAGALVPIYRDGSVRVNQGGTEMGQGLHTKIRQPAADRLGPMLEELLWDAQGRVATAGAPTYKLPSWPEVGEIFNVAFPERAAEPGVVFGSKAVGEPPLMLAVSVREAFRDAIAAFGESGTVELNSPAMPERICRAIEDARASGRVSASPPTGALRG